MKKWILGLLGLCACVVCGLAGVKSASYVQDSSAYVSFGIDIHDIDKVIESNAASLLDSQYVRTLQGKRLLAIADIANETSEDIDVELMARKLARALRKSGKFTLTNAIAGSGAKADRFIKDSRKLTKDPNYNQYTTDEQDTLQAPELSLSGKIAQRSKKIGEVVRVDYIFLLTLSDIKSGKVLWDHEEIISKVADPSVSSEMERQSEDKKLLALRAQCKNDDEKACRALFEKGDIQGLKSACERQVGYACAAAGGHYDKNNDVKQATLWYKKGCDIDNLLSCASYYYLIENYTQAFKLFTKACDGGSMVACSNLGFLYRNGQGVKQNGAKALELYGKACESGEKYSCFGAGLTYYFGNAGVKKDYTKARSYYTKACGLDHGDSCYNLGLMYANGEGGAKDEAKAFDMYEKAFKLFTKACDGGSMVACSNLGFLYQNGQGVKRNGAKALELYGKACDLGYQDGCEAYKQLKNAGY